MKMYEELAEEKAEKENRELRRQPRERDHAGEQRKKVERVRQREEEGKILQCNEGKWDFHFDEESVKGSIILDLHVSRRVDIKILRRLRAEYSRLPRRHRRDACSMAWRCRFLTARPSQDGRIIAKK
jgi:hypothetical protein